MFKGILLKGILVLSIASPLITDAQVGSCKSNGGELFLWISGKISSSDHARLLPLECNQLSKIESYKSDEVLITSGRSKGRYIICLSDNKGYPCINKIGELIGMEQPATLIGRIFDAGSTKPEFLNETVERLYLKPSKLMR